MPTANPEWEDVCELVGAIFDVSGALLLANRYLRVPFFQLVSALLSSVWRGELALDLKEISNLVQEDEIKSIRGILLLIVGFIVRTIPAIVHLCF